MPYKVQELPNGKYGIYKLVSGGKIKVGESDTREKAEASVRAREAATKGK